MLGPILRGEKITLEPLQHEDLGLLAEWQQDLEVLGYLMELHIPTRQQLGDWYDEAAKGNSAVIWRIVAEGRTIGTTTITDIDWINRHGVTSLRIGEPDMRSKGYGAEAVRLRAAFAFEELGLERLEAESRDDNVAMHRALERAGYRRVGTRHRYAYAHGKWHDAYIFELLRPGSG